MRQIINISLPKQMAKAVKDEVKTGNYGSTSEFFRRLVREWQEQQLYEHVKASQREIAAGKGKLLRSLKDLR